MKARCRMQIVINIPEEMYKWVYDVNKRFDDYGKGDFIDLIRNGTLIPNGHGRLIDADKLNRKDINCANVPMNFIDTAPTIIEAHGGNAE
jgi:hypothetical protein